MNNKQKILELVMIVKNSGEILRKCLINNRQYIDHWTILDTGSVDNTCEIIKEELKDIPGNLYYSDFVDFSTTRNKSLELCSKTCKYIIILDDSYMIHGGDHLLKFLKKSNNSCSSIIIGNLENNNLHNQYYSKRIIKTSSNLMFKYRVHEEIDCEDTKYIEDKRIFINDVKIQDHVIRSNKRYKNDIKMLLLDFNEKYNNDEKIIYYLGMTYNNLDDYENAIKYFEILKNMKNIFIDYTYAGYYYSTCIKFYLDDDKDNLKNELIKIISIFNNYPVPKYKYAILLKEENDIVKADKIISEIIKYPIKKITTIISESDIQEYYIPYLYIELKILLKQYDIAINELKRMLDIFPYNQPLLNIKYNICNVKNISSLKLSDNKTIVIHTGGETGIVQFWNPLDKKDQRISGSEYMAINLGKEFIKIGFRVFIIGSFKNIEDNIDYQCVYEDIQYIDYKYFSEFALKYIIDYLIISRYAAELIYYDNIKRVYLWVHDVIPMLEDHKSKCIQTHKEKFKYIIAVSEWQKHNIIKELNIPQDIIKVSRNAIYNRRFINKNIIKTPFRFIYSSSPDRGLYKLLNIIPNIKEKYPETTLYIFVDKKRIDNDMLKLINQYDYIFLNDRIDQELIALEYLKSDIWLYPTDFTETYCITALEAMAAKCLVATVDYAGLGDIVRGRSITCKHPVEENIDELLKKLYLVLDNPDIKNRYIEKAYNWAINQTYENLCKEWLNFL